MTSLKHIEVIEVVGKIDASNSETIRQVVKESLRQGAHYILIDCKAMKSMDVSGLSSLILALKLTRSSGSRLCLCSISDRLKMMLQLTGLEQVFEVFPNRFEFEKSLG